jgi:ABC-type nitrate/sulfonate/bicarbonate transport system substrate-binding protein
MTQQPRLKIAIATYGHTKAIKSGAVAIAGVEPELVEVAPIIGAFRRMVRDLEFDVCEMAITTYLCAKEHGVAFTALPVFLVRGFHHGAITQNTTLGLTSPRDLEGRRVGVNRGYTVTTGVWARGILEREYGVDLDRITWVLSGDEHVAAYRPPANVVPMPAGADLGDLLAGGELAAAIGVDAASDSVAPLIPSAAEAGYAALERDGHYPINHLVVVRDELLAQQPGLAEDLFDAFSESKNRYVDDLRAGAIAEPTAVDRMHERVMAITGRDPLPYGLEPNRGVLEELVGHAMRQHILTERPDIDAVFAAPTRTLVG